jgi:hypothetical protein
MDHVPVLAWIIVALLGLWGVIWILYLIGGGARLLSTASKDQVAVGSDRPGRWCQLLALRP